MSLRSTGLTMTCTLLLLAGGCSKDNNPQTLSTASNSSPAGATRLAATGQTTCYNDAGNEISCSSTGQDGEKRAGAKVSGPRFTDHGDGTVTDNLTGLMWMKAANCIKTIHPTADAIGTFGDGYVSWEVGLNFAKDVNAGTYACNITTPYTDWRLPNRRELQSLADYRFYNPAITNAAGTAQSGEADPFTGYEGGFYLSSTSVATTPSFYWYGNLAEGSTSYATANKATFHGFVWLTRTASTTAPARPAPTGQTGCYATDGSPIDCAGTGQDGELQAGVAMPSPRFTDNHDGTVTDHLTGLVWLRAGNCIADRLPHLDTDNTAGDGKVTWQHALDFIAGLNYGAHACGQTVNYTDWRLPNVREMESLLNANYIDPVLSNALGDGHFSEGDPFQGIEHDWYWTSTSRSLYGTGPMIHAWVVDLKYGNPDPGTLAHSSKANITGNVNFVWPVRGGN